MDKVIETTVCPDCDERTMTIKKKEIYEEDLETTIIIAECSNCCHTIKAHSEEALKKIWYK